MIAGQRPFSYWDKIVDEYMQRSGKDVIQEIHEGNKGKGFKDRQWE
jgi:hypothetical protein